MKFTRQQAYENIVAKLTKNGEKLDLPERSINEQLDTLIKVGANEETELEDFVKSFLPLFVTANANVRNDVSAGINKYKEDHPAPDTKKDDKDKKGGKDKPTDNESALEKRLAELEGRIAEQDRVSKISGIKKQLKDSLKEKGVKDEDWISSMLDVAAINEECDVVKQSETLLGLYNKFVASVDPSRVPKGNPGGQGGQNSLEEKIKAAADYAKGNLAN